MPWNENGPPKRSNYDIAFKRMQSAEKSFQRKECFAIVNGEVQKLLERHFVIKVAAEEVDPSQPEWYLPLQAVFTPERTTNVRLVFDASSKGHDGLSLNDHLEKGPNCINSLPNVLMAWRWNEVAYSGDIRKMFNQVLVHPDDQVFHRFLWRSDKSETPSVFQIRYIKSNSNPADVLRRAIHLNHLMKWSEGPSFLELPEEKWPNFQDHTQVNTHVDDLEALKEKKTFQKEKKAGKHLTAAAEVCPELGQPESEEILSFYICWKRVLRTPRYEELLPTSVALFEK